MGIKAESWLSVRRQDPVADSALITFEARTRVRVDLFVLGKPVGSLRYQDRETAAAVLLRLGMQRSVGPLPCSCGSVRPYVQEIPDVGIQVGCKHCGVTVVLGPEKALFGAILEWNRLQGVLKKADWGTAGT